MAIATNPRVLSDDLLTRGAEHTPIYDRENRFFTVDTALDLAGGFGMFKQAGIEQLCRDARLGRLYPANALLTREFVARTALGISIDETPRWG